MWSKPRPATTVLITGCSPHGIGAALAREFHRRGCRVIATIRNPSHTPHLVYLGLNPTDILILDVTSTSSVSRLPRAVRELLAPPDPASAGLDILVNNAGAGYSATFLDSRPGAARRVFDVNLWGVVAVTQALAPLLVVSGRGRIVNIGSVFGELAPPFTGFYNASKAALRSLSETMRVEMGPLGVQVTCIVSGIVASNIISSSPVDFPPTSPYDSARPHMQAYVHGQPFAYGMCGRRADADAYARELVARCLRPDLGAVVWCGYLAWVAWVVARFLPFWLRDWILVKFTGLDMVDLDLVKRRYAKGKAAE